MITTTPVAQPKSAISAIAARLTLAASGLFLVLFATLHIIEPEYAPSWRMVSEYADGKYGWVMTLAFLTLSFSCVTVFIAVRSSVNTRGGKIGLGVLLATAAALFGAALFPMDPLTTAPSAGTIHGMLHGFVSLVGVPGLPLAALLIGRSLRRNLAWSGSKRGLAWAANFAGLSFILLVLTVGIMLPLAGGKFGPQVWTGWANRILMLGYAGWLMTTAWYALKVRKQTV